MLCKLFNISFSLFDTKWNAQKYSQWESFLKSGFYEWGIMNYYTLPNKHSISVITVVHRLIDSKIKIINKYWIYIRRNLQIIKNSHTKCVKDEWFRSSLVFDTIFLKQISPLTQSLMLWNSPMSTSQDKIIYSTDLYIYIYIYIYLFI